MPWMDKCTVNNYLKFFLEILLLWWYFLEWVGNQVVSSHWKFNLALYRGLQTQPEQDNKDFSLIFVNQSLIFSRNKLSVRALIKGTGFRDGFQICWQKELTNLGLKQECGRFQNISQVSLILYKKKEIARGGRRYFFGGCAFARMQPFF